MTDGGRLGRLVSGVRGSTLVRNALSNYVAAAWMAGASLLTIPIYLRVLGPSEWGIVSACITLQGFLGLLDAGFAQIMPRSFARAAGDPLEEERLFRAYSRIYLTLAGVAFVVGQLAAGIAARRWFHPPEVDAWRLELALRLILVQFVFQFANNAHTGFWSGMQLQEEGNLRATVFLTIRHAGALAGVCFVGPSAFWYLVPFAAGAALEWTSNRRAIGRRYRVLGKEVGALDSRQLRAIVREAAGFTVSILVGLVATQLDRIVLSATQDLTQYGYYVIVFSLAMGFLNLQGPLFKALFPRIAAEDARGPGSAGRALRTLLLWTLLVSVGPCLVAIAFAPRLLAVWLRSPEIVAAATPSLRLLLAAVALNALHGVVYMKMLSEGASRVAIAISLACLAAAGAVIWALGTKVGIVLGGAIWISITVTQLLIGITWLVRRRLRW